MTWVLISWIHFISTSLIHKAPRLWQQPWPDQLQDCCLRFGGCPPVVQPLLGCVCRSKRSRLNEECQIQQIENSKFHVSNLKEGWLKEFDKIVLYSFALSIFKVETSKISSLSSFLLLPLYIQHSVLLIVSKILLQLTGLNHELPCNGGICGFNPRTRPRGLLW